MSSLQHVTDAIAAGLDVMRQREAERQTRIQELQKLKQDVLALGFLLKESDPFFSASPASKLTQLDLALLRAIPGQLEALEKMEGPQGEQGESGVIGPMGPAGQNAVFDAELVRPLIEEALAKIEKDEPFDIATVLPLIDKALASYEETHQENTFQLGTKEIDETTLIDGGFIMYDEKTNKLVYAKIKEGKGKKLGGASFASLRNHPYTVTNLTTNGTLASTDGYVRVDATSGPITVTLPTAVGRDGRPYIIKKIDSSTNAVTVAAAAGETIDGSTTYSLAYQNMSIQIISNASTWDLT
jgi:hypothetical protein